MLRYSVLLASLALALVPSQASAQPLLQNIDRGLLGDWVDQTNMVDLDDPDSLEEYSGQLGFLQLTAEGMFQQAHAMQSLSLQNSALIQGPQGVQLGVKLATFPFGTIENKVGKTENTTYSPVFPLLDVGFGATTEGDISWSAGLAAAPPVTVGGATARVLGVRGSVATPLSEKLRVGAELDYTRGKALAPVVAAKSQAVGCEWGDDGRPLDPSTCALSNTPAGRYVEVCEPQEFGCIDTLTFNHLNLRGGVAYSMNPFVQPYLKLGVLRFSQTFHVEVDDTKWGLKGILPTAALGNSAIIGDHIRLGVGATATYRPWTMTEDGNGVFYRFDFGFSYVL